MTTQQRVHSRNKSNHVKSEYTDSSNTPKELRLARKLYPKLINTSWKPVVNGILSVSCFGIAIRFLDYKYFGNFSMIKLPKTGCCLLAYLVGIFLIRIKETRTTSVCYEMGWGCNQALALCSLGCLLGRPLLIGTAIGVVALDQTLWTLDMISFLFRGKWLIGAAGYLSDPEQTMIRNLTSLHHLWFIPMAMSCLSAGKSYLHRGAFPVAMALGTLSMVYGRCCTPKSVWCPLTNAVKQRLLRQKTQEKSSKKEDSGLMVDGDHYLEYMNVNCGYEFTPRVKNGIIHYFNEQPGYIYIPTVASMLIVLQFPIFAFLHKLSDQYLKSV